MAQKIYDVTTGKLEAVSGAIYIKRGGLKTADEILAAQELSFDPATEPDWEQPGEIGEGAVSFERTAETFEKKAHSKTLSTVYYGFLTKFTIGFISTTDRDVLELIYGPENVRVTADSLVAEEVGAQPLDYAVLIIGKTDDGRDVRFLAYNAKANPEMKWSWKEDELTTYEQEFTCGRVSGYKGTCAQIVQLHEDDLPVTPTP